MPNEPLVHAAHVYIAHPDIQTIYNSKRGGFGTVIAITTEQAIVISHAVNSTAKRRGWDL